MRLEAGEGSHHMAPQSDTDPTGPWVGLPLPERGLGLRVEKNPFAESSTGSCLVAFPWDVQDFHQPPAHFPARSSVNAQFSLPTYLSVVSRSTPLPGNFTPFYPPPTSRVLDICIHNFFCLRNHVLKSWWAAVLRPD